MSDSTPEPDSLEPIYGRSAEPIACDRCGEATTHWWREGDARVCSPCKSW